MGLKDKKEWKIICLVNVITQILLNLFLGILQYQYGSGIVEHLLKLIPLEIVVTVIEMVIYHKKLKSYLKYPVLYAFLANLSSAFIGYFLIGL